MHVDRIYRACFGGGLEILMVGRSFQKELLWKNLPGGTMTLAVRFSKPT